MVSISKIRNNSWLLIVVIGLALAAFILMDMKSGSNRMSAADQFRMGTVDGMDIDRRDFDRMETVLYSNQTNDNVYGRKSFLWNFFVDDAILTNMGEKLGIGISPDEIKELEFGTNLSPVIQQRFRDQNTGQINREQLNAIQQQIEANTMAPELYNYWAAQREEIKKERMQQKVSALAAKAIYTPAWYARMRSTEQNTTADVDFVMIPYNSIDDAKVTVADDDYKQYFEANRGRYIVNEPTRTARYATFPVIATAVDSQNILDEVKEIRANFAKAENDSLFIINEGVPYDPVYYSNEALGAISDSISTRKVGQIYGPYQLDGQYRVSKVLGRKVIPDSVEARHILRSVKTQDELAAAISTIDSLKEEIEKGNLTFEQAAEAYGMDGTRTKGGDLGYFSEGRMVAPFNNLVFFQAKKGKLYKIFTQFGVHLVEVTGQKFITNTSKTQLGTLGRDIVPSAETQEQIYNRLFDLVSANPTLEEMEKALQSENVSFVNSQPKKQNDFKLGEMGTDVTSREIIRWMFQKGVKVGDISPEVFRVKQPQLYYDKEYVIAGLKYINPENSNDYKIYKEEMMLPVLNSKKAEFIESQVQDKSNLESIAEKFGQEVQSQNGLSIGGGNAGVLNGEPKVLGNLFNAKAGDVVGPIEGNSGTFYLLVKNKNEGEPSQDLSSIQKLNSSLGKNQTNYKLMPALRKQTKIEDRRYNFY